MLFFRCLGEAGAGGVGAGERGGAAAHGGGDGGDGRRRQHHRHHAGATWCRNNANGTHSAKSHHHHISGEILVTYTNDKLMQYQELRHANLSKLRKLKDTEQWAKYELSAINQKIPNVTWGPMQLFVLSIFSV